jgi:activator of HSP90 ATPase
MNKTIEQTVEFSTSPDQLYETYLDSKKHSAACGADVSIVAKVGGKMNAFGGAIVGENLLLVPSKMLVQRWRAKDWKKSDLDSVLVLMFSKTKSGGQIHLVHSNVPESAYGKISGGWKQFYWDNWKKHF